MEQWEHFKSCKYKSKLSSVGVSFMPAIFAQLQVQVQRSSLVLNTDQWVWWLRRTLSASPISGLMVAQSNKLKVYKA